MELYFFFFSRRSWHTIFDCDWSSDVYSSDLVQRQHAREMHGPHADAAQRRARRQQVQPAEALASPDALRRSQGHEGAQYGNAIGQGHQAHAPGGLDDLIRLNGFIHVGSSSFAEKWDNTRVIAAVLPVGEAWQAIPPRSEERRVGKECRSR